MPEDTTIAANPPPSAPTTALPQNQLHPTPEAPPQPVPDYRPDFTPAITHDLRPSKSEAGKEDVLAPLNTSSMEDPAKAKRMVQIPEDELLRLQLASKLEVVAIELEETEMPAAQAESLTRAMVETYHRLQPSSTSNDTSGGPMIPLTPLNTGKEEEEAQRKRRRKAIIYGSVALFILIAAVVGLFLRDRARKKNTNPIQAASQPQQSQAPSRSFNPTPNAWSVGISQTFPMAHNSISWITSDPVQPGTWQMLAQVAKRTPGMAISVFVISDTITSRDLIPFASQYNIATYLIPISSRCNTALIDNVLVIDGSNDIGLWHTNVLSDIDRYTTMLNKTYLPKARMVFNPNPQPKQAPAPEKSKSAPRRK